MTMAASSFKKKVIGFFASLLDAIPVYRPQDYKFTGQGLVVVKGNQVIGEETNFLDSYKDSQIEVNGEVSIIEKVVSQTEMLLKSPIEVASLQPFAILPKVNNDELFSRIHEAINEGSNLMIFPEGTSHDQSDIIKLKTGISHIALGAATRFSKKKITIIPIGLNYFDREKFRSSVIISYGKPIDISEEWVEEYRTNPKMASEKCMLEVEKVQL